VIGTNLAEFFAWLKTILLLFHLKIGDARVGSRCAAGRNNITARIENNTLLENRYASIMRYEKCVNK